MERDIKGQVFSIQEGEQGLRSDKLFCKQPPQILPAGGSPSAHCFVYQSASIVLRGHWSTAPCHFPPPSSYRKPGLLQPVPPLHPPLDTASQNKGDYLLLLPPALPPLLPPILFPPSGSSFSVFSVCFKGLSLKTSPLASFTSSPLASFSSPSSPSSRLRHPSNSCFDVRKTLFFY